ncbi:TPA: sigma-70 family RNA polymerase sigma factor [Klebsiella pneumoniae]|nr:sigma-70 family RNA polymerase sigma factor [Klebsiella pneumoniae]
MTSKSISPSEALAVIFRSDYRWLTEKIRRRISHGICPEDIASEAFARLIAIPELSNLREPRAMLSTIAYRVLYETWRRRDLERAYLDSLTGTPQYTSPSPEMQEIIIESLLAIDYALDGLSVKARTAFLLNQLDGMTYAEISRELNVSVSMVRKYVAAALAKCYMATAEPNN